MFNENNRIRCPIPTRELERRWKAIRQKMKEQGLDALVMQNDNQFLGGYVRYFTDIPSEQGYPMTVIFPLEEEMTVITSGGPPMPPLPPEWASRGIKNKIGVPYFRSLNYTNYLDAEATVKSLRELKVKSVGLVGFAMMSAMFHQYLVENLPNVDLVNATDLVDEIKAIKSQDELVFINKAVRIHDDIMKAMPVIVRPGRYEYEIRSEVQRLLTDLGSEEQWIMLGSAKPGNKTPQLHTFYQNRMLEDGDHFMIMVEVNGPGGYYAEISRTFCLSEPTRELMDAWDTTLEAQQLIARMLKPGASPKELLKAYNDFIATKGWPAEGRLFAHGQGYDLVERPAFVNGEEMLLEENMFVAIHPMLSNDAVHAMCCDNYLVTEDGGVLLYETPQKIFTIG